MKFKEKRSREKKNKGSYRKNLKKKDKRKQKTNRKKKENEMSTKRSKDKENKKKTKKASNKVLMWFFFGFFKRFLKSHGKSFPLFLA